MLKQFHSAAGSLTRFSWFRRARVGAAGLCLALTVGAAPPTAALLPEIPDGSRRVFSFEVVGSTADRARGGDRADGRSILVNWGARGVRVRVEKSGTGWGVADWNALADQQATLSTKAPGVYDVYARVLGDPIEDARAGAETLADRATGETLLFVKTIVLKEGDRPSEFVLAPADLFDARLQEVLWSMDFSGDLRIAQFRIYSRS